MISETLTDALEEWKKLDVGMAKKQRLHTLIVKSYKNGSKCDVQELALLSRGEIVSKKYQIKEVKVKAR